MIDSDDKGIDMNNYKERLDVLEQKLKDRGVVDVKFHFDRSKTHSLEEIAEDVISVLEAMLEGKTTPYVPKYIFDHEGPNYLAKPNTGSDNQF